MFNKFFEGILHRFMYGHNIFRMVGKMKICPKRNSKNSLISYMIKYKIKQISYGFTHETAAEEIQYGCPKSCSYSFQ